MYIHSSFFLHSSETPTWTYKYYMGALKLQIWFTFIAFVDYRFLYICCILVGRYMWGIRLVFTSERRAWRLFERSKYFFFRHILNNIGMFTHYEYWEMDYGSSAGLQWGCLVTMQLFSDVPKPSKEVYQIIVFMWFVGSFGSQHLCP